MEIKLGNVNFNSLIDDEDLPKLKGHTFKLNCFGYAYCWDKETGYTLMHHMIVGKSMEGKYVDHINGNRYDNRKANLRFVTPGESAMNRHTKKSEKVLSKYRGVTFDKSRNKWQARLTYKYRTIHLGRFETEQSAALAYNEGIIKYYPNHAILNTIC